MSRLLSLVLLCVVCFGCAGRLDNHIYLPQEIQAADSMPVCCHSFAEMNFQPLQSDAATEFSIDDSDRTFVFGSDGLSRFKAFQLPDHSQDQDLVVSSYVLIDDSPEGIAQNVAFFFPKLVFLDESRRPVGTTQPSDIRFYSSLQSDEWNRPSKLEIVLSLNRWPNARYVIVYTSHDLLASGNDYDVYNPGVTVAAGNVPVTIGSGSGGVHFFGSPISPKNNLKIRFRSP